MRKVLVALLAVAVAGFLWIAWLGHAFSDAAAVGEFRALRETLPRGTARAAVETELARRHLRWNYFLDGSVYNTRGDVPASKYPHPPITVLVPAGSSIFCSYQRLGTISFDDADRVTDVGAPWVQSMCA